MRALTFAQTDEKMKKNTHTQRERELSRVIHTHILGWEGKKYVNKNFREMVNASKSLQKLLRAALGVASCVCYSFSASNFIFVGRGTSVSCHADKHRTLIYPKPFILIVYLDGWCWCWCCYCISHRSLPFHRCVAGENVRPQHVCVNVCVFAFGTQA